MYKEIEMDHNFRYIDPVCPLIILVEINVIFSPDNFFLEKSQN